MTIIKCSSTSLGNTSPRSVGPCGAGLCGAGPCGAGRYAAGRYAALLAACLAFGCAGTPAPPPEVPAASLEPDPLETPGEEGSSLEEQEPVAPEPPPAPAAAPDLTAAPDPDPMAPEPPALPAAARRPAPVAAEQPEPVYTDFNEFWRRFRDGLLKPDFNALARLTTFPVTTRGPSDRIPPGSVDRTQFSQLIRLLLSQDVGESNKQEPLSEYLKRAPTVPPNAVTGPTARVTHLQFALDASGWRFVGAYLND